MRSPLRAMQGFADALLEDYQDRLDAKGRDYLERIARASKRLDLLIQDVLAYSRIAKGEIALRPVDLERLIEEILPDHPEFQPPRASITVEKPLHKVMGHEAYLTQCVTNLLGNAVKFVPPGTLPEIRIRSEAKEGKVRVWFEDNGIGINPSHFERIFQIFGQVYGGKQYGGTGIGLAIVRKASQRMGGGAGVESELGKGSRFWIMLNEANYDNAPRATAD
jgi:signal transduction histidine kinase